MRHLVDRSFTVQLLFLITMYIRPDRFGRSSCSFLEEHLLQATDLAPLNNMISETDCDEETISAISLPSLQPGDPQKHKPIYCFPQQPTANNLEYSSSKNPSATKMYSSPPNGPAASSPLQPPSSSASGPLYPTKQQSQTATRITPPSASSRTPRT